MYTFSPTVVKLVLLRNKMIGNELFLQYYVTAIS